MLKLTFRVTLVFVTMVILLAGMLLPVQAKSSARLLQSNGDFLWAKSVDVVLRSPSNMVRDADNNIYITGTFNGTVDFDPGLGTTELTSAGTDKTIFISKFDSAGNFLWVRSMGFLWMGGSGISSSGIVLDSNANIYMTGSFTDTVDFDPGPGVYDLTSVGDYDVFVSKLDHDGNFIWAKSMGGLSFDSSSAVSLDSDGNVYTTGNFKKTVDFDPGAGITNQTCGTHVYFTCIFISKLDSNGFFVWAKSVGEAEALGYLHHSRDIAIDTSHNVYVIGEFRFTADFDPGPAVFNLNSASGETTFVLKLDSDGNFVWAKNIVAQTDIGWASMALDNNANVYFAGMFSDQVDFDPSPSVENLTPVHTYDSFVCKWDSDGNFVWVRALGGATSFYPNNNTASITVDENSHVYTIGYFQDTADFDPGPGLANLTSTGDKDIFISKLNGNGDFIWAGQMGGTQSDYGTDIMLDATGSLYATGMFTGVADLDPGPSTANLTSSTEADAFIVKLENDVPTLSPTVTPTVTETATITPTASPTGTMTMTFTASPSPSPSPTGTMTGTMTATSTITSTTTPTFTVSPSATSTVTATASYTVTPTSTSTATKPAPTTVTFTSIAAQDGWILESSETSNIGGLTNVTDTTLRLGDDADNKQYRGILSFNTSSLPDTAVITKVILKFKKLDVIGSGNPFASLHGLLIGIKTGFFGTTAALQAADFQATANKSEGPFQVNIGANVYTSFNLPSAKDTINKLSTNGGLTQLRLRFASGDNNNELANYIRLYSGNAAIANRPQLVITYYVP